MDDASQLNLPDDVAGLKTLCATFAAQLAQRNTTIIQQQTKLTDQQTKIQWLANELLRLRKYLYGPRADRLTSVDGAAQLLLEFVQQLESLPVNADDAGKDDTDLAELRRVGASRRHKHGRRRIADLDHLPTHVFEHELSQEEQLCPCCGKPRARIGCEESWQIEYVPGHFERWCHRCATYACPDCDRQAEGAQVETAKKPGESSGPIEKGMAGPGLLAYIVTSKYADYLPLYRLENIFERNGLELARSTQSVWCGDVADMADPLYDLMADRVRASHVVATDDTTMPMQARGKTIAARMWIYSGDAANPYNVFHFTPNRTRDGPAQFLKGFTGTLLADGYGGYDGVVAGNGITRAGCWAHARRKFVDAEKSEPAIAKEAVTLINAMFAVERTIKDAAMDAIAAARRTRTQPIFEHLHERLLRWRGELLPKHPMAAAVRYVLNQLQELKAFLIDPAVPMDNNLAEREMKRQALNRKNSLFVANLRGGRTAAILSSLTSSCRRHGVDPQAYLTQLLVNRPTTPRDELHLWLPDAWKARQAASAPQT